jgi:hypothetical protein
MSDLTYSFFSRMLKLVYWHGTLLGGENLPVHGSAVFVANHLAAAGPIGVVCTIPLRFYTWIIADMIDKKRAPDYLRQDFIETSLKLKPPFSIFVARGLSLITVPFLTSIGCIPVTRGDGKELTLSVAALKEGKVVLVFPEAPELEIDPLTQMRPFLKGFTRLGEMYYAETGKQLHFYPVAVHGSQRVMVGEAVVFDPTNPRSRERLRLKHQLEGKVQEMYLELAG